MYGRLSTNNRDYNCKTRPNKFPPARYRFWRSKSSPTNICVKINPFTFKIDSVIFDNLSEPVSDYIIKPGISSQIPYSQLYFLYFLQQLFYFLMEISQNRTFEYFYVLNLPMLKI